jgi:hypothetical protein
VGEGQVHVVAAQHQVVADADAGELGRAAVGAGLDLHQREVGGAAAHVAHQHQPGLGQLGGEGGAVAEDPVLEGGLGFLDQAQPRQAGEAGGLDGEGPGAFVEGGRDGEHDVLLGQRVAGKLRVPGGPHVGQVAGAGGEGDTLATSSGAPQGRIAALRSTPGCDSQLLALATSRPGTWAPRSRA